MPDYHHRPVLLAEVLECLVPGAGGHFLDGTLGGGGHAEALLSRCRRLTGCDRDGDAVRVAGERLSRFGARVEIRHACFERAGDWIAPGSLDGALLDLGVSSPQLERAERGFSFLRDGPLDMRMDRSQERTAAHLVNSLPEEELAGILFEYGGERQSRRLARAMVAERRRGPLERTLQLARLVERVLPGRRRIHPATRTFQALRMVVNDEPGTLERGLRAIGPLLRPGGRLAVISFHSAECRKVKQYGRDAGEKLAMRWAVRKAIRAGLEERTGNPRSRSARLRVLERLSAG